MCSAFDARTRPVNLATQLFSSSMSFHTPIANKSVNCKTLSFYIYFCHKDDMTKENQEEVPTLYWLPKLHKNPIKQDLLLILVLVRQQNFLNC